MFGLQNGLVWMGVGAKGAEFTCVEIGGEGQKGEHVNISLDRGMSRGEETCLLRSRLCSVVADMLRWPGRASVERL